MISSKKFFSFFLLLFLLFPTPNMYAEAVSVSNWPKPNDIMSKIEKRYHLNQDSLKSLGEGLNVSEQKKTAPEVLLFFSPSNPVPGQEITAQANPLYFSNPKEDIYFTWYLKRKDCDTDGSVQDDDVNKFCDTDDNGKINEEDWKIEAMRLIANAGLDTTRFSDTDTDTDGYQAYFGGNNNKRMSMSKRCAIQDFTTGTIYEFSGGSSTVDFGCPTGYTAKCVEKEVPLSCSDADYSICKDTGITPTCLDSVVTCEGAVDADEDEEPDQDDNITARCVPTGFATPVCTDPGLQNTTCSNIGSFINSCSINSSAVSENCEHLFPNSPGDTTGDGEFTTQEEKFWKTNPQDPDTAGTGYGDEANVAGLGQDSFTWLYEVGDMVGVVVEGTSLIPTKHDESSYAVMWALPKNDCPIENTSSYQKTIRGYDVIIPTTNTDINDCLERNLIDPREGGQTGKLNIALHYTPETVFNDASGNNSGDQLTVSSTIENTETPKNILHYEWKVFKSEDGSFDPRGFRADPNKDTTAKKWIDITNELRNKKLLSFTEGNNIDHISIKLNLPDLEEKEYLKVEVRATEYVDLDKKKREDVASIVIPITSTDTYISAKGITVSSDASNNNKLSLGDSICEETVNEETNPLGIGRGLCLVVKNEIIGLTLAGGSFKDFQWTANGQPLICTKEMSEKCSDSSSTDTTFLPVTGNVGEKYDVALTALNVEKGEKISISRTFLIVDPLVQIQSANKDTAWPKYLGYYEDTRGYAYGDYSDREFQRYPGGINTFSLQFIPSWIKNRSHWTWSLNGNPLPKDASSVEFSLPDSIGNVSTLSVSGDSLQDNAIRNALRLFWGYSPFDSSEYHFSHQIQIQTVVNDEEVALASPKGLFAALAKNISKQLVFILQLFLWILSLIILLGGLFSLRNSQEKK